MDHVHNTTTPTRQQDLQERLGSSEERIDHLKRDNVVSSPAEYASTENSIGCMAFDPIKYQSYKEYIAAILKTWPEYRNLHDFLNSASAAWSRSLQISETLLVIADSICRNKGFPPR
jgi:hypothetical protein